MSSKRLRSQRVARIAVQSASFSKMASRWKQKDALTKPDNKGEKQ